MCVRVCAGAAHCFMRPTLHLHLQVDETKFRLTDDIAKALEDDNINGKNVTLRTMGRGDYFGERALLYDEPRSAGVCCTQDDTALWAIWKVISRKDFSSSVSGSSLFFKR